MKKFLLSAVLALGLMAGGIGIGSAQAQYGGHHHGHCNTGYGVGYGGYSSYRPNYGGYYSGYSSYRNVPPVVLGQIYTQPVYRTLPYSSNFGGYYGSGYNGMGYSNLAPVWAWATAVLVATVVSAPAFRLALAPTAIASKPAWACLFCLSIFCQSLI